MPWGNRSLSVKVWGLLLLSIFGFTALLLAAVAVYGVMAYSVAQCAHEIGVRMALGADRQSVRNMILREGLPKGTLGSFVEHVGHSFFPVC
jgi:ABC-type antimicrobial peptide transport system permease subunit